MGTSQVTGIPLTLPQLREEPLSGIMERKSMRDCMEEVFKGLSPSQRQRFQEDVHLQGKSIAEELKRRRLEKIKNG